MKQLVSIIVPVFNKCEYTKNCLKSIFKNKENSLNIEIIVVDNHSTDNTSEVLKEFQGIKVIRNQENLGFSKACNIGANASNGNMLLFLNNDTVVFPNWLTPLVETLNSNQEISIVGSKLLFPDDTIQHAGVVICSRKIPRHIYYRLPSDHPAVNKIRDFQIVTAACFLIRKDVFNEVGKFDENYINGYEDVDLCLKVKEAGYRIVYNPNSVLYHFESVSTGRFDKVSHNTRLLEEKWSKKLKQDDIMYYIQDEMIKVQQDDIGNFNISISGEIPIKNISYGTKELFCKSENSSISQIRVKNLRDIFQKIFK